MASKPAPDKTRRHKATVPAKKSTKSPAGGAKKSAGTPT